MRIGANSGTNWRMRRDLVNAAQKQVRSRTDKVNKREIKGRGLIYIVIREVGNSDRSLDSICKRALL